LREDWPQLVELGRPLGRRRSRVKATCVGCGPCRLGVGGTAPLERSLGGWGARALRKDWPREAGPSPWPEEKVKGADVVARVW
jgi:hypothetical protein